MTQYQEAVVNKLLESDSPLRKSFSKYSNKKLFRLRSAANEEILNHEEQIAILIAAAEIIDEITMEENRKTSFWNRLIYG